MKKINYFLILGLCASSTMADDKVKDMSDPLAVYTQVGSGLTNKGINIKIGQTYDTGSPKTQAMNIIEIKGFGGEIFGWDDDETVLNDSVDFFRIRNFNVDVTTGRGSQIDFNYNLHAEAGTASFSLMQAILPKKGNFSFFPLAGLGLAFANNAVEDDGSIDDGYSIPGTFALVGVFAKYQLNKKIWINYNPFWSVGVSGADSFKDHGFEGSSSVLTHEVAFSYQINPRLNVRYFSNWSENIHFSDGDQRIEFNYQY